MPTKSELLNDPNSAWNTAHDDEQLFILRGTDSIAPFALRRYAKACRRQGLNHEAYKQLFLLAKVMEHDERRVLPFDPSAQ